MIAVAEECIFHLIFKITDIIIKLKALVDS